MAIRAGPQLPVGASVGCSRCGAVRLPCRALRRAAEGLIWRRFGVEVSNAVNERIKSLSNPVGLLVVGSMPLSWPVLCGAISRTEIHQQPRLLWRVVGGPKTFLALDNGNITLEGRLPELQITRVDIEAQLHVGEVVRRR